MTIPKEPAGFPEQTGDSILWTLEKFVSEIVEAGKPEDPDSVLLGEKHVKTGYFPDRTVYIARGSQTGFRNTDSRERVRTGSHSDRPMRKTHACPAGSDRFSPTLEIAFPALAPGSRLSVD
jgi:hypothetical protein